MDSEQDQRRFRLRKVKWKKPSPTAMIYCMLLHFYLTTRPQLVRITFNPLKGASFDVSNVKTATVAIRSREEFESAKASRRIEFFAWTLTCPIITLDARFPPKTTLFRQLSNNGFKTLRCFGLHLLTRPE